MYFFIDNNAEFETDDGFDFKYTNFILIKSII